MKALKRVLLTLLALYLSLSLAASAIVQWSDNNDITREIVNNRFGLMIINYDSFSDTLAFLSPFNNYPDIFLLVIDFTDGVDLYTDGLDFFGHW